MKRVLIVFPTAWDRKQFEHCRADWSDSYELVFAEPSDEECRWDFDVLAFIDRMVEQHRGRIDGVFSSSDYPGATVAGAVAERLGLPGTPAERLLRCGHKYYSRLVQQAAAPQATPRFELLDPVSPSAGLSLGFPCFVKPVKGAFSVLARRIDSPQELHAFLSQPAVAEFTQIYLEIFNRLVRRYTRFEYDGGYFLAEELLTGIQVTVEGFCAGDDVQVLGVVDSVLHPGTNSFARFDYPSRLPADVQDRAADIAARTARGAGLRDTLFNIELMYDPATERIRVIELNPRICGQFGDLYAKVDGRHSYAMALDLATGRRPDVPRRRGRYGCAASVPLRSFEPVRVLHAPDADRVRAVEAGSPGTLVWNECETGQVLGGAAELEDGFSERYAVVNLGAADPDDLARRTVEILERLDFRFLPTAIPQRPAA